MSGSALNYAREFSGLKMAGNSGCLGFKDDSYVGQYLCMYIPAASSAEGVPGQLDGHAPS